MSYQNPAFATIDAQLQALKKQKADLPKPQAKQQELKLLNKTTIPQLETQIKSHTGTTDSERKLAAAQQKADQLRREIDALKEEIAKMDDQIRSKQNERRAMQKLPEKQLIQLAVKNLLDTRGTAMSWIPEHKKAGTGWTSAVFRTKVDVNVDGQSARMLGGNKDVTLSAHFHRDGHDDKVLIYDANEHVIGQYEDTAKINEIWNAVKALPAWSGGGYAVKRKAIGAHVGYRNKLEDGHFGFGAYDTEYGLDYRVDGQAIGGYQDIADYAYGPQPVGGYGALGDGTDVGLAALQSMALLLGVFMVLFCFCCIAAMCFGVGFVYSRAMAIGNKKAIFRAEEDEV